VPVRIAYLTDACNARYVYHMRKRPFIVIAINDNKGEILLCFDIQNSVAQKLFLVFIFSKEFEVYFLNELPSI
jgi:hypothetical protein